MQLIPLGRQQFFDNSGALLAGGKVYFYELGTRVPCDTWPTNDAAGQPNPNPVILGGAGEAVIWGHKSFHQVVMDASGNTVWEADVTTPVSREELAAGDGSSLVGFTPSDTSLMIRTLEARGRDWVLLTDFCVGDGSDEREGLLAAVATGKLVFAPKPPVVYGFSGQINVVRGFVGEGWFVPTFKALSADACFIVNSHGTLENFIVDGSGLADLMITTTSHANRVFIQRVRVQNCAGDGIQLQATQNSSLVECFVQYCAGNHFRISGAENCKLRDCNSNQADPVTPGSPTPAELACRGILVESSTDSVGTRNLEVTGGIYERGDSDYQVEVRDGVVSATFQGEINGGTIAGVLLQNNSGSVTFDRTPWTRNVNTGLCVNGLGSAPYSIAGSPSVSGAGGRVPSSLFVGAANFDSDRWRPWINVNFEVSAEGFLPSGNSTPTAVFNPVTRTLDCTAQYPGAGVRYIPALNGFATEFGGAANRIADFEIYVTELSVPGDKPLARPPQVRISTITGTRTPAESVFLALGMNRFYIELMANDVGILLTASTTDPISWSMKSVRVRYS